MNGKEDPAVKLFFLIHGSPYFVKPAWVPVNFTMNKFNNENKNKTFKEPYNYGNFLTSSNVLPTRSQLQTSVNNSLASVNNSSQLADTRKNP